MGLRVERGGRRGGKKGAKGEIYIYGWNILHNHIAKWWNYVFRGWRRGWDEEQDTLGWKRDPIKFCVCFGRNELWDARKKKKVSGDERLVYRHLRTGPGLFRSFKKAKLWHILRPFLFRLRYWHFLLLRPLLSPRKNRFQFCSSSLFDFFLCSSRGRVANIKSK